MNLPGIQNALAALTALNSSSGSKAPTSMQGGQTTFKQALSQEVAQRQEAFHPPAKPQASAKPQPSPRPQQAAAQHAPQQAAKPEDGDKAKQADEADKSEAQAADNTAAPADAAAPVAQAGTDRPQEKPAEDSAASLADIPGAPQAALMMQLMNTTPPATAAPAADATLALDAAFAGTAGKDARDAAASGPLDLRAVAGKNAVAAAGQAAIHEAAASTDLQQAFGKAMADAGEHAAQALTAAQADTPAANAAPAALAALQAAVQAVHAPAGHVDKLTPAVGTPAWDQALGQKIVWMAQGGEQTATLTMNPPDLGPMQVVLSVSNNQATVDFMSAQPEVRQALESALPRLREMMGESGVQLGQANVSAGSQQQQFGAGFGGQHRSGARSAGNDGLAIDDSAPQLRQGIVRMSRDGVVDTFA